VRDIAKTVECLDSCNWWSKPTAAERAIGAIDLSEEHHDIVRISAGTVERSVLPGTKDRPSDLGTPRTFLGSVLGSHEIVLSQWSFNGQRMLRHVGCQ
jgi:hypothetical protein